MAEPRAPSQRQPSALEEALSTPEERPLALLLETELEETRAQRIWRKLERAPARSVWEGVWVWGSFGGSMPSSC